MTRSAAPVDSFVLALVRGRIAQADIVELLTPPDSSHDQHLSERAQALHARLTTIGADYDAGLIDGPRYAAASERVRAELAAIDRERAKRFGSPALTSTLSAPDPVAAFDRASLMIRRGVIDALLEARLDRAPRGSRTFDAASVHVGWKGPPSGEMGRARER